MVAPDAGEDLTIDLHTHILPHGWPDLEQRYGGSGWLRLVDESADRARLMSGDSCFRHIDSRCWDAGRRLADCDAAGVDVQVLSTVPVMFSYWARPEHALDLARILNDHLAGVVRDHPARFVAAHGRMTPDSSPSKKVRSTSREARAASTPSRVTESLRIGRPPRSGLRLGTSSHSMSPLVLRRSSVR